MQRNTIAIADFNANIFSVLDKGWMLLTAGDMTDFNPMTVSWGFMGTFWAKPIAIAGVRPQRHTFGFMEKHDSFTLTAFPEDKKEILTFCGTKSGRDVEKVEACKLTPIASQKVAAPGFEEANLIIECRKVYAHQIESAGFIDKSIIGEIYPTEDFHKLFFGEVVHISGTDKYTA